MSTNKINPTEKTGEYLTNNSGFDPNANVDAVGDFNYESWNGGTGVGSKGNVGRLASDYINYNYDSFTKGSDYASLAKRYSDNGRKAMEDTVGQIAARTGGLASSYATVAGQQTYGDWMSRLEDAARSLYDSQKSEKMNAYNLAQGLYDRGYSEYSDGYNRAYNKWTTDVGIAQGKDSNAMEMYNTGLSNAKWHDEVTTDQNNEDRDRDDDLRSEEEDSLYDYIYAGNSYDSYDAYVQANDGKTLLTEADFNRIVGEAQGTYKNDNRQKEEDSLYNFIYAGGSYTNYSAYKTANPNTALTEADFNRIVGEAQGTYSENNKTTKDEELRGIFSDPDFLWGDWDGDGKVGTADTNGEVDTNGNKISFEDVFGGSSYGEEYWRNYHTGIKNQSQLTEFSDDVYMDLYLMSDEDLASMTWASYIKDGVTVPEGFDERDFKMLKQQVISGRTATVEEDVEFNSDDWKPTLTKDETLEALKSGDLSPNLLKNYEHFFGESYIEKQFKATDWDYIKDLLNQTDKDGNKIFSLEDLHTIFGPAIDTWLAYDEAGCQDYIKSLPDNHPLVEYLYYINGAK